MKPEIKTVVVLGSGTMGNGITQSVAMSGKYKVVMVDVNQAAVDNGMKIIEKSLGRIVKKGKMTKDESQAVLSKITPTMEFESVKEADFVVEAIPEIMELKVDTFKKLDEMCPAHTIFGTNTSSLPITAVAATIDRPESVIGTHFMNPVPIMKGVEVVKGRMTSQETIDRTLSFLESFGKKPCMAVDYAGFVNSRLLNLYLNEAVLSVMDGNTPEEVDKIMLYTANMPIGPLRLLDMVGIDVHLTIMEILRKEFGDRFRVAPLTRQMVSAGHLGMKTGRGFFEY